MGVTLEKETTNIFDLTIPQDTEPVLPVLDFTESLTPLDWDKINVWFFSENGYIWEAGAVIKFANPNLSEQYNYDKNRAVTFRHNRMLRVVPIAGLIPLSNAFICAKITSPSMFKQIDKDEVWGKDTPLINDLLWRIRELLTDKPGPIRDLSLLTVGYNTALLYPDVDLEMGEAKEELMQTMITESLFAKKMLMAAMFRVIFSLHKDLKLQKHNDNLNNYLRKMLDSSDYKSHQEFCQVLLSWLILSAKKIDITKEEVKLIFASGKTSQEDKIQDLPDIRSF